MADQVDLTLRIIRASIKVAGMNMRTVAKPEPELGAPDTLHDIGQTEGIPDDRLADVERLANALRFFGESVRVAERNDRPITRVLGETIKKPKTRRSPNASTPNQVQDMRPRKKKIPMSRKKKIKRTYPVYLRGPCEWKYPDSPPDDGEVKATLYSENKLCLNEVVWPDGVYEPITMERDQIGVFHGMIPGVGNAALSITKDDGEAITMSGLWLEGSEKYDWTMTLDVVRNFKDED